MVTDIIRVRQPEIGSTETPARQLSRILPPVQDEKDNILGTIRTSIPSIQATPKKLLIGSLPDDRLRVNNAIDVTIKREREIYIARCDTLDEFGYGESPTEAIEDLQLVLVELYWTLREEEEKLGTGMVEVWKHLRELIQER